VLLLSTYRLLIVLPRIVPKCRVVKSRNDEVNSQVLNTENTQIHVRFKALREVVMNVLSIGIKCRVVRSKSSDVSRGIC
jgi:hypothetical protein